MAGVAVKHLDRLIYAVLLSGRSNALGVRMILFAASAAIVGGIERLGRSNDSFRRTSGDRGGTERPRRSK